MSRVLTVDDLLLVSALCGLISLPDELVDLVLELCLERANLLEHDAQLDQVGDHLGALGRGERGGLELEGEDGDHVVKVRQEKVILEREKRDPGRVSQCWGG